LQLQATFAVQTAYIDIVNASMTLEKAIEGCKKQDRLSQKYLYDAYADAMMMLCMRYVNNLQDAEELMLNGFLNFFRTIDRFIFSGTDSISAWLKKIMVNECLMFLRKKGMRLVDEEHAAEIAHGEDHLDRLAAHELFHLITTLPAGYRTVFNLFVVEGYGHKEIATMLNITEGASKSQLNKARKQLQKTILSHK
jgi:RNA polymerase sigma factor (sigma-70 family)